MPTERTGYAPWSLTREAGVQSATVNGTIQVPQYVYPNLDCGFIDEKGNWKGRKSSDEQFIGITTHLAVANGGIVLAPATANIDFIDMTGFEDLFLAIKTTNGGSYPVAAVMGPDTNAFANLRPINPASNLRGSVFGRDNLGDLLTATVTLTSDVWDIFCMDGLFANQKNLQFKLTNSSGGNADIEVAFMRLV